MPATKKEMMATIVKCGKVAVFFCNNYALISHPMSGLIPFEMYKFQEAALMILKKTALV